jgi:hypothetical protein
MIPPTPPDPFEGWRAQRRGPGAPEGFSDRVMNAVRAAQARPGGGPARRPSSGALSVVAFAASVVAVAVCHAALIGGILLALGGTAH